MRIIRLFCVALLSTTLSCAAGTAPPAGVGTPEPAARTRAAAPAAKRQPVRPAVAPTASPQPVTKAAALVSAPIKKSSLKTPAAKPPPLSASIAGLAVRAKVLEKAKVVGVTDGDTVTVVISSTGQPEKVRLIGIDTPEKGRPFYDEATAMTRRLLLGKTVGMAKDVSQRDMYDRLLRFIWVGERLVNAELVRLGYATAYTYPPDVSKAELFVSMQQQARTAGRGLWKVAGNRARADGKYLASRKGKKFHRAGCRWAKRISERNLQAFDSAGEARDSGKTPCRTCLPG